MKSKIILTRLEIFRAIASCISDNPAKQIEWVKENKESWDCFENIDARPSVYCIAPIFIVLGMHRCDNYERELKEILCPKDLMDLNDTVIDLFKTKANCSEDTRINEIVVLMYSEKDGFKKVAYNLGYYEPVSSEVDLEDITSQNIVYFEDDLPFDKIPENCVPFVELPYIWEVEYRLQEADYTMLETYEFKSVDNALEKGITTLYHCAKLHLCNTVTVRNRWFDFCISVEHLRDKDIDSLTYAEFKENVEIKIFATDDEDY